MRDHPRAVERDLLVMGLRRCDLSLSELASVVLAAPPGSAVRWSTQQGWDVTDHLIANLTEQLAGLIQLKSRYPRPGIPDADEANELPGGLDTVDEARHVDANTVRGAVLAGGKFDTFDTPADFEKKLAAALTQNMVSDTNQPEEVTT